MGKALPIPAVAAFLRHAAPVRCPDRLLIPNGGSMKTIVVLSVVLLFPALFLACEDSGINDPKAGSQQEPGSLSLMFSSAPPEISHVVATLSRSGYTTQMLTLTIDDSNQTASGSFDEVAIGLWHLRVQALNDSNVVRYAGETDVDVRPGQVTQVNLQLLPTSGGIRIIVSWGMPPNPSGGLMAYYPLNGTANDASGNGNHGVISGAVPVANRHGTPNSALWFDGIDDKITIPSSQSLHPFNQLTISFWIRVDSMKNNYLALIHKGGEAILQPWLANREYAIYLKQNLSAYYFQTYSAGNGGAQHEVHSTSYYPHQWLFFAAVVDRRNHSIRCYVNGTPNSEANDSYTSFNINNFPLTIGAEAETVWPDHSTFFGALDEIRLYSRTLTAAEIMALYNTP